MANFSFEVIDGDGCGRMFAMHEDAQQQIDQASEQDREEIAAGIVRAYGKVMRLLYDMSRQSYSPKQQSIELAALCADVVMFDIGRFALKCRLMIVESMIKIEVLSVCPQATIANYQRYVMREIH